MVYENAYIISGGVKGKTRLNTLSDVLYPYTRALLKSCGLREGHTLLDLGCGGGNVAMLAASIVDDSGGVTAVDFDQDIVHLARLDAQRNDIDNIVFRTASAYEINFSNEFDMAYARFLLSHLQEPAVGLERMIQGVKPGGKVVVEDVQFSGHFSVPSCSAFDTYVRYYSEAARNNGQNAEIGPELVTMFRNAGLRHVGFDVIQPCFNSGSGKWMGWLTLDRIKDTLIDQGISSPDDVNSLLTEIEAFTNDESTIMSLPRIFRVWGMK
jgi:ubiquinone/menaquinone biosynthesis C-methylase UbiE